MTGSGALYICLKKQRAMNIIGKLVQYIAKNRAENLYRFLLYLFIGLYPVIFYLETLILNKYPLHFLFSSLAVCHSFPVIRNTS